MYAPELYCLTFGAEPASGLGQGSGVAFVWPIGSCAERMLKSDVQGICSDVSLTPGATRGH